MKKIRLLLATTLVLFASTSFAQRNWSPEDIATMKEKRKITLVDSLGVTSVIADTILAIEDRSRAKLIDLRQSRAIREDRRTQLQAINNQKNAEVKKVLSADAYTKYIGLEERNRNRMRKGMAGRRPAGN